LGTSGVVANYQIGDVTIPNQVIDSNNSVPFRRNLAHAYGADLSTRVTVHDETKHGRLQTVYQETEALLLEWKSKSVAAMDVEGIYLARFATSHSDLKLKALFVMSDQTLGDSTIDEDEARLDVIDDSVYKLVSFLLPRYWLRSNIRPIHRQRNKTESRISESENKPKDLNPNYKIRNGLVSNFLIFDYLKLFRLSDPSTSLRTGFEF
jgi:hypothetical protein